jgi:hypothetical protein
MAGGHAPRWAGKMENLGTSGAHTFMREKGFNIAKDTHPLAAGDNTMLAARGEQAPTGMPQLTDLPQYADKAPPMQVASLTDQMNRGDVPLPPHRPSEPLSSAEYLTHNFGAGDQAQRALPSVQNTAPAPPPMMTDSAMPPTGGVEGMASMMAPQMQGAGMGPMMANAFVPPQAAMGGPDMGTSFGGGGFDGGMGGGDFGGFNLGGLFG